jgi:hypothetical protein
MHAHVNFETEPKALRLAEKEMTMDSWLPVKAAKRRIATS